MKLLSNPQQTEAFAQIATSAQIIRQELACVSLSFLSEVWTK